MEKLLEATLRLKKAEQIHLNSGDLLGRITLETLSPEDALKLAPLMLLPSESHEVKVVIEVGRND